MNYSKEEFFALMEQADMQGVEHLDEICGPVTYEFGEKSRPVTIRGCGHSAIFAIPLDGKPVKVCAVEDDMGRWPRFGGDRFGREVTSA